MLAFLIIITGGLFCTFWRGSLLSGRLCSSVMMSEAWIGEVVRFFGYLSSDLFAVCLDGFVEVVYIAVASSVSRSLLKINRF